MVLLKVSSISPRCYTNEDGDRVRQKIQPLLEAGQKVVLSFEGVDAIPSSFVNTAFISLLDHLDFDFIKSHLDFRETSIQINKMIKSRFEFEVARRRAQMDSDD